MIKIKTNRKLAPLTTFKTGGKAEYFCAPRSLDELKEALGFAKNGKLETNIIGGGSNLLVSSGGVRGLVIYTGMLDKISIDGCRATALCGASMRDVNSRLSKASLSGMEFSGGLPGSIGGAVYMNARAYNSEMSNVVESVKALDPDANEIELSKAKINFSYKKSIFMERKELFIYSVCLKLCEGSKKEISTLYAGNLRDRKSKGQFDYPSAGCVFKNDYSTNTQAGRLIDELGLKGKQIGKAKVYERHANFIINTGNAKPEDIFELIRFIEKQAAEKKNIGLEREIVLLGF